MIRKYAFLFTLGFASSLSAMNPEENYCRQLQEVAQQRGDINLEARRGIVEQAHDWGLAHQPQLLAGAYEGIVDDYMWRLHGDNKNATYNSLSQVLDKYADVNCEGAMEKLDPLITKVALKGDFCSRYSSDLPVFPISMLQVLKKRNPTKFELVAKEAIEKKFSSFLRLALAHPEQMEKLQDKRLNVGFFIQTVLDGDQTYQRSWDKKENLEHILKDGTACHIRFEKAIANELPAALKESQLKRELFGLFQSPSQYLREQSFSTLLNYVKDAEGDSFWKEAIIRDILREEKEVPLQGEPLYHELFNTLLKSDPPTRDFGTQSLIQHLMKQPTHTELGRSFLTQYFNLPAGQACQEQQLSINGAFAKAFSNETVPLEQLSNMCKVAKKTGFEQFLDSDTVQQLKIKIVQSKEAEERAQQLKWLELFLDPDVAPQRMEEVRGLAGTEEDHGRQLEKAAQDHSDLDLETKKIIVNRAHDWALVHNPQLLDKAYEKLIDSYMWCFHSNDRDVAYDSLPNVLDQYADVNHESAMKYLKHLIKKEVLKQEFVWRYSDDLSIFPIKLFQVLKKRISNEFEQVSKDAVEKRLYSFLALAFAHPKEMSSLEDERLNVNCLIKTALQNVKSNPKEKESLEIILRHGTAYHAQFEQEIAKVLPAVLKNRWIGHELIELFESPSHFLRNSALSTLLQYIKDGDEDTYWKEIIIADIFKHEASAPVQGKQLYGELFNTFLNSTSPISDFGTQSLILHLCSQPTYGELVYFFVANYLNIPPNQTFKSQSVSISDVFECAVEAETVTLEQLNNVCSVAQKTGFDRYINPDIIQKLKTKMIVNEAIPNKERAQFLGDLLISRITSGKSYDDLAKNIDQLPFSPFKRYAHAILIALNQELHETAHFAARADLVELSKEHSEFSSDPNILFRCFGRLFEAFDEWQKPEAGHIHTVVKQDFSNPNFTEGPYCFGYVCKNDDMKYTYRLYACNKKTGLPVWRSPIVGKEKLPYAIRKDSMYCATEIGTVIQLDPSTGSPLREFSSQGKEEIKKLYVTPDQEKLYVFCEESATFIDLKTDEYHKIMFPDKSNHNFASFVGNKLIIPSRKDFFIIDSNGKTMTMPHHSSKYSFPRVKGTDQFMVYVKEDKQTDKPSLVCLDSNTSKQLWEYPIDSSKKSIKISPDGDRLFVLTDRAVMAFNPNLKESSPLVWKTELERNFLSEIDSIYLSNDASALYGLEGNYGKLYKFDTKTGKKTFLYEKKLSRVQNIVGDYDGKLYMQGIHF